MLETLVTAETLQGTTLAANVVNASLTANTGNLVNTGTLTSTGSFTVSNGNCIIGSTGTSGPILELTRSAGTVSVWDIYLPSGSTDLRFFSGVDVLSLKTTGVAVTGTLITTLASGVIQAINNFGTGINFNLLATGGKDGFISFTEDGVADRWVIRSMHADANLYFSVGATNSTTNVLTLGTAGATVTGTLDVSARATVKLLAIGPAPTDTYGANMTIAVTSSLHVVAGVSTTSATVTYTPSAAGTAGDRLVIITSASASGTVTATFASTFHSSGTQVTTASHFSTIEFISDGTRWLEMSRTTNLA